MTSNSETLKRLIRIWAIIEDTSPKTVMYQLMRDLKIKSLNDEDAQKLAVTYLRHKLNTKGDD